MSNRVLFPSLLDRLSQLKLTRYLQMDVFFKSLWSKKVLRAYHRFIK